MIEEKQILLVLSPDTPLRARVITMTPEMVDTYLVKGWWEEDCLKDSFEERPVDQHWNWKNVEVEVDGRILRSTTVAAVTGQGERLVVHGAMVVSIDAAASVLEAAAPCLFVELLSTAPRNRPALRKDHHHLVLGVGTQLLIWAACLSREMGFEGRLRLDGSPDFVRWYESRGLQTLGLDPIVFQGVLYTPMELSADAAAKLLSEWE